MEDKQTVKDIKVRGKIVLVRTDYNVPLKDGKVESTLRLEASLPTIKYLLDKGAKKVILISHLGRPDGQKVKDLSLKPIAAELAKLLPDTKVRFIDDISGPDVEDAVESLPNHSVLLLENLRFYPGEEKNSADLAREIAESTHAEIFVEDGFAVIHRAHASTDAITREMPSVAGLLIEKECKGLDAVLDSPKHPFLVIIGGAKVEDKVPLIDKYSKIADNIVVVGKIAADGFTSDNQKIYVAEDFVTNATGEKLDIGPKSIAKISDLIANAKTILWNGLAGKAEEEGFATGSAAIAEAIGKNHSAVSVICGGDTTAFVENYATSKKDLSYTLISTGGGAALEYLTGAPLPGLSALDDK